MLKQIREKNKKYKIEKVENKAFSKYGKVITGYSFKEMEKYVRSTEMPDTEFYIPCEPKLMNMDEADIIKDYIYGQVPCQIGYYNGRMSKLNALEYHKCSEILILLEDCILIVGSLTDLENGKIDSDKLKFFYAKGGTCVELYATTLHWAPCMVSDAGVRQVVVQSQGTNTPLLKPVENMIGENKYLLERNKWVIIHEEAKDIFPSAHIGIVGENPEIVF